MPVPAPSIPTPFTWLHGQPVSAPMLRDDVLNAVTLLTSPPLFSGAQTGAPSSFTCSFASPAVFTAAGAAFANGNVVVLSALSGSFGPTAGTLYYVVNAGVNGPGTFNLATTPAGTGINSTGTGSGTVSLTETLNTGKWTPLNLDTQVADPYGGHLLTQNLPYYFGMFPGWYLVTLTTPMNYIAGAGSVSAGLTVYEPPATSTVATYGGARIPTSGTSGIFASPSIAKLVQFSSTGSYGAAGNNYVAAAMWQDTGSSTVTPLAGTARYPQLNAEWVAGTTFSPALGVPDIDSWPSPPQYVTSTMANKAIRDTISFLAGRPVMEATYAAGGFSLAAQGSLPSVGTTLPLDTVHVDPWGAFSTGTSTWTAPVPGVYEFHAQSASNGAATTTAAAVGLTVTSANYDSGTQYTMWGRGAQTALGAGFVNSAVMSRRLRLNAGDTVKLAGFQADSGSHAATVPGFPASAWSPRLIAVWRSR